MKIELAKYRVNFNVIKKHIEEHGFSDRNMSLLSIATMCPIIVVYYYASEIVGMTPGIQFKIDSLKKFYGYKEIV